MEWLDKTIDEFEKKQKAEKAAREEERKRLEEESIKTIEATTAALNSAYEFLNEYKKNLQQKKYPASLDSDRMLDVKMNKQVTREVTFIVSNKGLRQGEKLNTTIFPFLTMRASGDAVIVTEDTKKDLRNPPKENRIKIRDLDVNYLESLVKGFLGEVFS